ncbi:MULTISPECIES: hypothetical protein [unclassified Pseudomonas]|uniref:hypothetical protein n=1 Tax=unclassified Pseudomonas TaxID=196821 RepID=UPI000BD07887|nr:MULTISPECIES: hypothetical protein [unclassified Pseudomonas]PVZ15996.1 hypothetical protein F474_01498 [Pseudomonas sp. URIL14HWK12:I12]PVZ26148.1 hypothetical protein F470_01612 [Pseudomonas sp. URIL14HWK12:I10]PVZ36328.1 hypothetical protein F472_01498 [Pseudomonas sp. URIL14HWK12:I11]SNZ18390.1 hypothetical protein SAMN05660463_03962 [Pseudomonas sp. URIL14HWK12:I9]
MRSDAILTQDELDFIQTMNRSQAASAPENLSTLLLNGGDQIKDLLARLLANEQVTIQAQFENQQLRFPLQLVEDEFHAQHVKLGSPIIYEDGPMLRPWRLALPEPVQLAEDDGRPSELWLVELSFNGVLVEVRNGARVPRHFALWFNPEGYDPVSLHGALERQTKDGFFAYRLTLCNPQEMEQLRDYILQQHRLSHPRLHTS